jgi:hypothetical protein
LAAHGTNPQLKLTSVLLTTEPFAGTGIFGGLLGLATQAAVRVAVGLSATDTTKLFQSDHVLYPRPLCERIRQ